MCVDEALRLRDPSYVARAEENFAKAAKAGNASAARYLERVWPLEKPELLRRIQDPIA